MNFNWKKPFNIVFTIIFTTSQVLLGSLAEAHFYDKDYRRARSVTRANFWQERKEALAQKNKPQLASLPAHFSGSPLLNQLSSVPPTNFSLSKWDASKIGFEDSLPPQIQKLLESIPLNNCTIQDVYISEEAKSPPVILIQDVHLNPEAQSNIASTIQELINQKMLGKVGVEGAFSKFDFSRFRAFPDKTITQEVAKAFLEKNLLAAPSYVGITSPIDPPQFLGVDDKEHYDANVKAYLDSRNLKADILKEIRKRKSALAERKQREFSPELLELDNLRAAYQRGNVGLGTYLKKMTRGLKGDGTLAQFLRAYDLEKSFDFAQVERERKIILEKLTRTLNEKELSELVSVSLAYRLDKIPFGAFYENLKNLCGKKGIHLTAAPSFEKYINYVLLADGIRANDLFDSIDRAETEAFQKCATTPRQKELVNQSEHLNLAEKLLDFALTPNEWEKYKRIVPSAESRVLSSKNIVFNALSNQHSAPSTYSLLPFEAFYREAEIRSQKMVENISDVIARRPEGLTKQSYGTMSQNGPVDNFNYRNGIASPPSSHQDVGTSHHYDFLLSGTAVRNDKATVLVSGGFHTPAIAQLLKKEKKSFIVLSPKITKVDEGSGTAYLSIFAREKTPLDQLFTGDKLFLSPSSLSAIGTGLEAAKLNTNKQLAFDAANHQVAHNRSGDPKLKTEPLPDGFVHVVGKEDGIEVEVDPKNPGDDKGVRTPNRTLEKAASLFLNQYIRSQRPGPLSWWVRFLASLGDPINGAPRWEWIFQAPLVAAFVLFGWDPTLLLTTLFGFSALFGALHFERTWREKGILVFVGLGISVLSVAPLMILGTSVFSVAIGLVINIHVHRAHNIAKLEGRLPAWWPSAKILTEEEMGVEVNTPEINLSEWANLRKEAWGKLLDGTNISLRMEIPRVRNLARVNPEKLNRAIEQKIKRMARVIGTSTAGEIKISIKWGRGNIHFVVAADRPQAGGPFTVAMADSKIKYLLEKNPEDLDDEQKLRQALLDFNYATAHLPQGDLDFEQWLKIMENLTTYGISYDTWRGQAPPIIWHFIDHLVKKFEGEPSLREDRLMAILRLHLLRMETDSEKNFRNGFTKDFLAKNLGKDLLRNLFSNSPAESGRDFDPVKLKELVPIIHRVSERMGIIPAGMDLTKPGRKPAFLYGQNDEMIANLEENNPRLYNLLFNEKNMAQLVKYATFLRHIFDHEIIRGDGVPPLRFAIENNMYFHLGGNIYLSPVTESFRRHIVFEMDPATGEVGRSFEIKVPGLSVDKRTLFIPSIDTANDVWDKNADDPISERPVTMIIFDKEMEVYGTKHTYPDMPPAVMLFEYTKDASRFTNIETKKLNHTRKGRQMKFEIAKAVLSILAKLHALGWRGGRDMWLENFRLILDPDHKSFQVFLAGDCDGYSRIENDAQREGEIYTVLDRLVTFTSSEDDSVRKKLESFYLSELEKYRAENRKGIPTGFQILTQRPGVGRIVKVDLAKLKDKEKWAKTLAELELKAGNNMGHSPTRLEMIWKETLKGGADLFLLFNETGELTGFLDAKNVGRRTYYISGLATKVDGLEKKEKGPFLLDVFFDFLLKRDIERVFWYAVGNSPRFFRKYLKDRGYSFKVRGKEFSVNLQPPHLPLSGRVAPGTMGLWHWLAQFLPQSTRPWATVIMGAVGEGTLIWGLGYWSSWSGAVAGFIFAGIILAHLLSGFLKWNSETQGWEVVFPLSSRAPPGSWISFGLAVAVSSSSLLAFIPSFLPLLSSPAALLGLPIFLAIIPHLIINLGIYSIVLTKNYAGPLSSKFVSPILAVLGLDDPAVIEKMTLGDPIMKGDLSIKTISLERAPPEIKEKLELLQRELAGDSFEFKLIYDGDQIIAICPQPGKEVEELGARLKAEISIVEVRALLSQIAVFFGSVPKGAVMELASHWEELKVPALNEFFDGFIQNRPADPLNISRLSQQLWERNNLSDVNRLINSLIGRLPDAEQKFTDLDRHIGRLERAVQLGSQIRERFRILDLTDYYLPLRRDGESIQGYEAKQTLRKKNLKNFLNGEPAWAQTMPVDEDQERFIRLSINFAHPIPTVQAQGIDPKDFQDNVALQGQGRQFVVDQSRNPTVYSPVDSSNKIADSHYHFSVLNFKQVYREHHLQLGHLDRHWPGGKRVLVVGAGSGTDLVTIYISWLKEQGLTWEEARDNPQLQPEIHVREINPFAVQGIKELARRLGIVNILVEQASGIPEQVAESQKYDLVIWNMPHIGISDRPLLTAGRLEAFHDSGKNSREALENVSKFLPKILAPQGLAILWNMIDARGEVDGQQVNYDVADYLKSKDETGIPRMDVTNSRDVFGIEAFANLTYYVTHAENSPGPQTKIRHQAASWALSFWVAKKLWPNQSEEETRFNAIIKVAPILETAAILGLFAIAALGLYFFFPQMLFSKGLFPSFLRGLIGLAINGIFSLLHYKGVYDSILIQDQPRPFTINDFGKLFGVGFLFHFVFMAGFFSFPLLGATGLVIVTTAGIILGATIHLAYNLSLFEFQKTQGFAATKALAERAHEIQDQYFVGPPILIGNEELRLFQLSDGYNGLNEQTFSDTNQVGYLAAKAARDAVQKWVKTFLTTQPKIDLSQNSILKIMAELMFHSNQAVDAAIGRHFANNPDSPGGTTATLAAVWTKANGDRVVMTAQRGDSPFFIFTKNEHGEEKLEQLAPFNITREDIQDDATILKIKSGEHEAEFTHIDLDEKSHLPEWFKSAIARDYHLGGLSGFQECWNSENFQYRSRVSNTLQGFPDNFTLITSKTIPAGHSFILVGTSDGVSDALTFQQMERVLRKSKNPEKIAKNLIDEVSIQQQKLVQAAKQILPLYDFVFGDLGITRHDFVPNRDSLVMWGQDNFKGVSPDFILGIIDYFNGVLRNALDPSSDEKLKRMAENCQKLADWADKEGLIRIKPDDQTVIAASFPGRSKWPFAFWAKPGKPANPKDILLNNIILAVQNNLKDRTAMLGALLQALNQGAATPLQLDGKFQSGEDPAFIDSETLHWQLRQILKEKVNEKELRREEAREIAVALASILALVMNSKDVEKFLIAVDEIPYAADQNKILNQIESLSSDLKKAYEEAAGAIDRWLKENTKFKNPAPLCLVVSNGKEALLQELNKNAVYEGILRNGGIRVLEGQFQTFVDLLKVVQPISEFASEEAWAQDVAGHTNRLVVHNLNNLPPDFFEFSNSRIDPKLARALRQSLEVYFILGMLNQAILLDQSLLPDFGNLLRILVQA